MLCLLGTRAAIVTGNFDLGFTKRGFYFFGSVSVTIVSCGRFFVFLVVEMCIEFGKQIPWPVDKPAACCRCSCEGVSARLESVLPNGGTMKYRYFNSSDGETIKDAVLVTHRQYINGNWIDVDDFSEYLDAAAIVTGKQIGRAHV